MPLKPFDPSRFTTNKAKPLPVILLLDVSGSMSEVLDGSYERTGKTVFEDGRKWEIVTGGQTRIDVLNQAVQEMISSLSREEQLEHEFLVSVVTFGGGVRLHLPPTKASGVAWTPLTAAGETPLGEAIAMAKGMIEDKQTTPSRAYRPVVILVSDGRPTDTWEPALQSFVESGRSAKCDRIALAIGAGAHEEMLRNFIAGTANQLFQASAARQILETFRRVTMSVTMRSKSQDPNQAPAIASLAMVGPAKEGPSAKPGTSQQPPAAPAQPAPATPPKASGGAEDGYW